MNIQEPKSNIKTSTCFLISFTTFLIGLHKLLFYRPHETFRKGVNSYGFTFSTSELILNTQRATALFTITLIFLILGFWFSLTAKSK